jgi:hypothetical protein
MKTMLILIAMLLVGNAFGGGFDFAAADAALRDPKNIGSLSASEKARPTVPGGFEMAEKAAKAQTPYVPTPDAPPRPSSTSYSIITLPDGRTTSVLTYH